MKYRRFFRFFFKKKAYEPSYYYLKCTSNLFTVACF